MHRLHWPVRAALLASALALAAAARAEEAAPAATPLPSSAAAAPAPTPEPSLQEQIDALQQQLRVLQQKVELAAQAEAAKARGAATLTAGAKDGFTLGSPDGSFVLRLRGYAQLDGRAYLGDRQDRAADSFLVRRARPIVEGTIWKRFGFRLMPDFGSGTTVLQDGYGEWTLATAAVLRAGKFKPPVGLERLQSATDIAFAERALPTALVPNRDVGVQLGGAVDGGRLEYALGIFDGVADGASTDVDSENGKDVAARLWLSPWKGMASPLAGLSFGIAGTRGRQSGTLTAPGLPSYKTAGQQTFFSYRSDGTAAGTVLADGARTRLAPQASFYAGPFGLLAEHVRSRQEVRRDAAAAGLEQRAWQVTAIWVLTGESASYRWHAPRHGFGGDADAGGRGWGALAVVARYDQLRADAAAFPTFASSSAVQEASGWAVGLDWTLQRYVRLLVDYGVTSFSGRGPARDDEKVVLTRFQLGW